jgi:hypothetical protein
VEETREQRPLTPERLAQWEGPKLGKHLRREMIEKANLLYEWVMILRLMDPSFEKELEELGATELLDRHTERLNQRREETRERIEQSQRAFSRQESGG